MIGILGGSFNPVHLGHIRICEAILARFPVEKCLLMPAYQNPNKWTTELASAEHRVNMIKLAISEFKELGIDYSTWEIDQQKTSYTIQTLQHFHEQKKDVLFIMGSDAFCDIASWKSYRELFSLADFAVVSRPSHTKLKALELIPPTLRQSFKEGGEQESLDKVSLEHKSGKKLHFITMPPFPISSSEVRRRIREGKDCSTVLPEKVIQYIYKNQLYLRVPESEEALDQI